MRDPSDDGAPELTLALRRLSTGSLEAEAEAIALLSRELHAIAAGYARGQRAGHTLQPTALVNEAFLKLVGSEGLADVQDRKHFYRVAARAMRQILVDHARRRVASKRGGSDAVRVTLNEELVGGTVSDAQVLDVELALVELADLDPRQARVVELRFFGGLDVAEAAEALEVSVSTVEREWRMARAWLGRRLGAGEA